MKLSDYIGKELAVVCPFISRDPVRIKLLNVEAIGVWIECPLLMDRALKLLGQTNLPKSPVFFVPYHELRFVYETND
jgi:hypothetical protein